jgi:glycosyltransferase involved in cell wall biosynthesis
VIRVAIAGNWPPPTGGVATHVAALAHGLERRGIDVTVLDIGEGEHRSALVRPARGPGPYTAALARVAAEGRLVHVHTTGANPRSWVVAFLGGRARLPFGPRAVLTLHSGLLPGWLRGAAHRRRMAAAACAGYGTIVAVNEEIAGAVAACGVPARKIQVVAPFSPNVVQDPLPPPAALAPLRAAARPLYAAALAPGPTYGADVLLPAFRRVRARNLHAGLVLFGPGADPGWQSEDGLVSLGELDHRTALGVIGAADVFVRPTRADGDAVSVREALAFGKAVVATRVGKRPEGCLLVPPTDVDALADAMVRAASGASRRARRDEPDPFDTLVAIYASHAASRPLTDGGRQRARAPTF